MGGYFIFNNRHRRPYRGWRNCLYDLYKMKILGIETSCDETGIALIEAYGGFSKPHFRVIKNLVASQIKIHAPYGGVVPNLAKREHEKNLPILLKRLLGGRTAKFAKFDYVAVTVGPGLEPCLWRGIEFAKEIARKHKKPIVAVNHMEGHLASVLLKNRSENIQHPTPNIQFPIIALLVSGGHSELVLIKKWLDYKIIGETLDDAVGEAFDKVARLLGLPYPGGPALAKLADSYGSTTAVKLPRPMINSKDLNFSFSGLKTAVLYALRDNPKINKPALAKEFQNAAVDVLVAKTLKAVEKYKPKTLIVAGGVSANKHLKTEISSAIKKFPSVQLLVPSHQFTGDNAAMIAAAAYFKASKKKFSAPSALKAEGRLRL